MRQHLSSTLKKFLKPIDTLLSRYTCKRCVYLGYSTPHHSSPPRSQHPLATKKFKQFCSQAPA